MDLEFTIKEKEFEELKEILKWATEKPLNIDMRANARNLLRIFTEEKE
jgi:hypothetical protein